MKNLLFFIFFTVIGRLWGAPPPGSPFIKVDQFGYLCNSAKVAVIANPQNGYNANESFLPGETYEVRRWDDESVVYNGAVVAWNEGQTHEQSGDQGWWFDFSTVTEPGSYYLYDPENGVASHRFEIGQDVYNDLLEQAVRMFYYQRLNYEKQSQYAGAWSDAAAFEGPNQDRAARDVNDKGNAATARDLHGGWMDAGDVNKYTTFAFSPLIQLLEAYRMNPTVFTDDYNIPESGNGVADLLDEVQYELDWLRRMQDATGTDGLMLKVGVLDFNKVSPISADTRPRYYVGECTSATIAGAAMFSLAGLVYQSLPQVELSAYGSDLIERAERAWERARATTQNYTVFETDCDSQEIKAGDADEPALEQQEYLVTAAVYLYEATGKAMYKEYVEDNYTEIRPFSESFWGPYRWGTAFALLKYTTLSDVSSEVAQAITSQKASQNFYASIDNYRAETDLYRAFMPDAQYSWGSNFIRSNVGNINLDFTSFSINEENTSLYREVAEQHLHWLNGVNPMGLAMLTNMYDHGAEYSANEIFHTWFADGTKYDNALTSEVGPAPGYLAGGPNKNYDVEAVNPPYGQPHQKSYRDWNIAWNGSFDEKAYQVTEPSISYQASYIILLSRLTPGEQRCLVETDPSPPAGDTTLTTPRYVYQEVLAEGWQNWSWLTDVDFEQSTVVQAGERALQVVYQQAGSGGLSLRSGEAIATAGYEAIQMELHGGSGAAQNIAVLIQTEDNGGASPAKTVTTTPEVWQTVTVRLSELGNPDTIKRITVQNISNQTPAPFYIDDLRLVANQTSPLLTSDKGSITVRAKGDCGSELMQLQVDGQVVKEWTVSTSMSDYEYAGFTGGQVSVHLVNDALGECDRNLTVDYITMCDTTYQTEEVATETATCCTNVADKLFTNGNFDFGTLTCGSAAQARGASDHAKVSPRKTTTETLEVYPNPGTNGVFHLKNAAKLSGEITVTDLSGRTVEKTPTLDNGTTIDLSGEPNGVYLLRTSTGQTIKLIKE